MIITDKFVYIHLHRTGGRFIRNILYDWFPSAREIGYHFPLSMLPRRYHHLPVLAFIRDPWDWYVSWYHFNAASARNPIFSVASNNGRLGFSDTIRHLLYLGSNQSPYFDLKIQMIKRLPKTIFSNHGAGIPQSALQIFNTADYGYYSWLVKRMLSDKEQIEPQIIIGRFEHLKVDLVSILREYGCQVNLNMVKMLNRRNPTNCSHHGDYLNYYNMALRKEVENQDFLSFSQLSSNKIIGSIKS